MRLAVVPHPTHDAPSALLHPATATRLGLPLLGGLLGLADGSDCVVEARVDASIAEGELALTPVQQFNLHAAAATSAEFRMFTPPPEEQPFELAEVEVEVMAVRRAVAAAPTQQQAAAAAGAAEGAGVEVDAREVEQELRGQCWGRPLAANEVVAVRAGGGRQLLLRVAAAHKLDAAARAEAVGYHCYRGALTTDTAVYLTSPLAGGSEAAGGGAVLLPQSTVAARVPVKLLNARRARAVGCTCCYWATFSTWRPLPPSFSTQHIRRPRPSRREPPQPGQSRRCVNVYTSDGEWFPVQRKLLRPCIALTKLVRSEEAAPTVHVGIDTLTFDRCARWHAVACCAGVPMARRARVVFARTRVGRQATLLPQPSQGAHLSRGAGAGAGATTLWPPPAGGAAGRCARAGAARARGGRVLQGGVQGAAARRGCCTASPLDAHSCACRATPPLHHPLSARSTARSGWASRSRSGGSTRSPRFRRSMRRGSAGSSLTGQVLQVLLVPWTHASPGPLGEGGGATTLPLTSHPDRADDPGRHALAARAPGRRHHHPRPGAQPGLQPLLRGVPCLARVVRVPHW